MSLVVNTIEKRTVYQLNAPILVFRYVGHQNMEYLSSEVCLNEEENFYNLISSECRAFAKDSFLGFNWDCCAYTFSNWEGTDAELLEKFNAAILLAVEAIDKNVTYTVP
jgi:hypothetical protein